MIRASAILLVLLLASLPALSAPPEAINLRRTTVVDVVERTKDAVVYVSSTKIINERFGFGNPFFQQFGMPNGQRVQATSLGSGFIVQADGCV